MKKGKLILVLILIAMSGVIVYAFFGGKIDNPVKEKNALTMGDEKKKESGGKPVEKPKVTGNADELEAHWNSYGENLPCEKNTVAIGQEFEYKGLSLVVNSFEVTKNIGDSDASYYLNENGSVKVDAEGNIVNEYTYIFVNVTVTNNNTTETQFSFSNFSYVPIIKKTGQMAERCVEGEILGYKTKEDLNSYDKGYFNYVFMPGQQYTGNFVFVQKEQGFSENDSYMIFNPTGGLYVPDDKVTFVKLSI